MKSDVIKVSGEGSQLEEALRTAAKVAVYNDLSVKNSLHLRLLTEEMMGMMRSITGESEGEFWIENEGPVHRLHLRVAAPSDLQRREQLVAASSSGKNEAYRGLMGKLRSFFEFYDTSSLYSFYNPFTLEGSAPLNGSMVWSMMEYRTLLEANRANQSEGAEEAWDELEKSVVSHVADDVKVSVRSDVAEMTIIKEMA